MPYPGLAETRGAGPPCARALAPVFAARPYRMLRVFLVAVFGRLLKNNKKRWDLYLP
jgi:hypothetical protein